MTNLDDIPWDDPATFDLLSRGDTHGIFQLSSPGMRGLLRSVQPRSLEDVATVLALYRPGPMDSGALEEYVSRRRAGTDKTHWRIHPELSILDDILEPTYGLCIFQESILEILGRVCGWGYGQADLVFNALRKKDAAKLAKAKPLFLRDGATSSISVAALGSLWAVIEPFADYSFNRAHSTGYAYIAYRGAYLKAHYPYQYMASLLTRSDDTEELTEDLAELSRMRVPLLPPDINVSEPAFRPAKEGVRYGIQSIKGVGEGAAQSISDQRPYDSIHEFFIRADSKVLNARVCEALIQSGCFDSLWDNRDSLLREAPRLSRLVSRHRKESDRGQPTIYRVDYSPKGAPQEGSTEEDSPGRITRYRQWELHLCGAEFTTGRITLGLSRALSDVEWQWVAEVLGRRPGSQPVFYSFGGIESGLGLYSAYSDDVSRWMAGVGIVMEES